MAKLIYAAIASLDGYVEDEEGRSDSRTSDRNAGGTPAVMPDRETALLRRGEEPDGVNRC
jgi:hypothetical protein